MIALQLFWEFLVACSIVLSPVAAAFDLRRIGLFILQRKQ